MFLNLWQQFGELFCFNVTPCTQQESVKKKVLHSVTQSGRIVTLSVRQAVSPNTGVGVPVAECERIPAARVQTQKTGGAEAAANCPSCPHLTVAKKKKKRKKARLI